jgi:hypothetical protein
MTDRRVDQPDHPLCADRCWKAAELEERQRIGAFPMDVGVRVRTCRPDSCYLTFRLWAEAQWQRDAAELPFIEDYPSGDVKP